jgi:hypothetical protein
MVYQKTEPREITRSVAPGFTGYLPINPSIVPGTYLSEPFNRNAMAQKPLKPKIPVKKSGGFLKRFSKQAGDKKKIESLQAQNAKLKEQIKNRQQQ